MRVLTRSLLRLAGFLFLLAVLVGVPVAVVASVGAPWLSLQRWRDLWHSHRVDTDVVVHLGAAAFLLLWLWFAATAVGELRRVLPHRRRPDEVVERQVGRGPAAMVCGLVRFVALSSVGAGLMAGGLSTVGHAEGRSAVTHMVVRGDSYWDIAEGHLDQTLGRDATNREVMALTEVLIQQNAPVLGHRNPTLLIPGETVVIVPADPVVPPSVGVAAPPSHVAAAPRPAATTPATTDVPTTAAPANAAPATSAPSTTVVVPTTTVVVPADAAPTETAPIGAAVSSPADDSSALPGLAGALLLAGGALVTIETRRRRQWRGATPTSVASTPTFAQARTELLLRSLDPAERLARVDVARRAAAPDLATQGAAVLAVAVSEAGEVTLHLRGSALPSSLLWRPDIARSVWRLPAEVSLEQLADEARECVAPCPALVHLGALDDGGELFVDLEAFGVVSIDPALGDSLARAVAASLAVSPFRTGGAVRVVGVEGLPAMDGLAWSDDAAGAVAAARADASMVGGWANGTSTFALRARADGDESWEPSLVVIGSVAGWVPSTDEVSAASGIGVLVVGDVPADCRVIGDGDAVVVQPFGLRVHPLDLSADAIDAVDDLLHVPPLDTVPLDPVPVDLVPVQVEPAVASVPTTWPPFVEPGWDLLVHTIGAVFVESADGGIAEFERSKSLELVVWMALHRERSTRSGARSAMWEVGVRSATFANVVSEARRALGALVAPAEGEDWIGRTLTDDLPLHPRVVTDAELLQARLDAARSMPAEQAIAVLHPGLELVTGLPFSSPCFAWVDGEGHTSALVLLATGAAVELARRHLELGDIDGVFWATGQGLKVLPGHEELIALRMRAHAAHGDLAGVRLEWEQYERALAADTWSPGEPSPKLVALRRELLGSPVGAQRG